MVLLVILASLILAVLLPLMFVDVMETSLLKLGLDPRSAFILIVAMFTGGMINLPIRRLVRTEAAVAHPLAAFGLTALWPGLRRIRRETVIAVNLGGCVIPVGVAIYEVVRLRAAGLSLVVPLTAAVLINTGLCYLISRPVRGVGIVMPTFLPAIVAAGSAYLLAPDLAPPMAFVAGVMGPIIGADLLHIREFSETAAGVVSIGGAGTFDGIVLSGIIAAYLA